MAKMKNKKNMSNRAGQNNREGQDFESEGVDTGSENQADNQEMNSDTEETSETNMQASGSRQMSSGTSRGSRQSDNQEFDPSQLLDSARDFIEGHPGRATLIGALVGGALAGLFATEKGRSLFGAAYSYSRPMIADYARNFINSQSGNAIERALPQ